MYITRKVSIRAYLFFLKFYSAFHSPNLHNNKVAFNHFLGTPAAEEGFIIRRLIKPANDFSRAISWAEDCRMFHSNCSQGHGRAFTPTRLIEVGSPTSTEKPLKIRLVPGHEVLGEYVTLSHCWGIKPVIQTTRQAISLFMKDILWSHLSKTFQDAIEITRALAVPYLWIDSLCIVQDDYHDWERESAKMGDIYAFAFLNIAAAASSDGSGGCFTPREGLENQVRMNYFDTSGEPAGTVVLSPYFAETFEKTVLRGPLLQRAWVVQERLLSKRRLYYAKDQLYWQCRQHGESESEVIDSSLYNDSRAQLKHAHMHQWHRTLEQYSRCSMTRSEDKLPAISGLAHSMASLLGLHYVAGLWQEYLGEDLLWQVVNPAASRRHPTYRAPSWSWAAIDGEISFSFYSLNGPKKSYLEDFDVKLQPKGTDSFGQLVSGTLTVTGKLKQLDFSLLSHGTNSSDVYVIDKQGNGCNSVHFDVAREPDGVVYSFLINGEDTDRAIPNLGPSHMLLRQYVLLLQSTGKENEFRRIGIAALTPKSYGIDFWEVPKARISII